MLVKIYETTLTKASGTTQYAAGDVLGEGAGSAVLELSGLTRFASNSNLRHGCILQSGIITSSSNAATKPDIDLLLFSSTIASLDADNATFTPTDAELNTLVAKVDFPVASWVAGDLGSDGAGSAFCSVANLGIAVCYDTLYGVLLMQNTYTPITVEAFRLRLFFVRDYAR